MHKLPTTASRLRRFMRERKFVRFKSRFNSGFIRGYVLDVGPKFFLIALQSGDQIRFDGFACHLIAHVKNLDRDPYSAFAEAALKRFGQRTPRKPRVNLETIEGLLLSVSKSFPLVTIHREKIYPDVCWIGKILEIERGQISLLEIGPNAKWDREPYRYKVREITTFEFGGEYEKALHLIGGNPPVNRNVT